MLKRMSLLLIAALSLGAAALAVAAPMDPVHMLTVAQAVPSPADLGAGVMMASAALAVPMPEQATMRAKLQVGMVQEQFYGQDGAKSAEVLSMHAVCKSGGYLDDGLDEDNTFAKFSPGASLSINIANPALFGKFAHGDKFYVDFTPAREST